MKEPWRAEQLEAQLEAAKDDLRNVDKNIRKILGRDVPDGENGTVPTPLRLNQKRPLQEDRRRQVPEFQNNEFGLKRRRQTGIGGGGGGGNTEPKTVFSRLSARVPSTADDSGDEDDNAFKPAVSSRVIATPREIPSRQDVIRRESTDERSRQRNKRMFGALLGTLQKFRQEETKLKAKEDKKAEVEARVEEAKRREREELKRERQQLFLNRKQQLAQVKALEAKLNRSRQFQDWRNAQIPLLNFIKTKTQPAIYYLPKRNTPETDTLLQESSKELKAEIDRREKMLVDELEMIQAQVGMGKSRQEKTMSVSDNQDQSMTEEPEELENRDPNPEKNGDVEVNHESEVDRSSNHDNDTKNEKEVRLNKENSDKEMNSDKETSFDKEMNSDKEMRSDRENSDKENSDKENSDKANSDKENSDKESSDKEDDNDNSMREVKQEIKLEENND